MWYIFLDYYSGDVGGVCSNENEVIRSEEECSNAVSKLDFEVSRTDYWRGSRNHDIPSGCSIRDPKLGRTDEKQLHMESSETGVGTGRSDLIPICKLGSYIGSLFISMI